MKVAHLEGKRLPVVWVDRDEDEATQPVFIALNEGAVAVLPLEMLKDWATQELDAREHDPNWPLDFSQICSSLVMQKPKSMDLVNVTVEVRPAPALELLIRYEVDGDRVCDSYSLR